MHTKIQQHIQKSFRTFGGGEVIPFNPVAAALKDEPLQFAAGVDVEDVIKVVLAESGFDDLLAACKKTTPMLKILLESFDKYTKGDGISLHKETRDAVEDVIFHAEQAIENAEK